MSPARSWPASRAVTEVAAATSIADLRLKAEARLPRMVFEYVEGGAYEEETLGRNRTDLQALTLQQRVMRDVSSRRLSTTMLGQPAAMPLALAPVGLCGMTWPNGEIAAANAAHKFGVPFCVSTLSLLSVEAMAEGVDGPFWFQLYTLRDRDFCRSILKRAWAVGCPVLVMTLDLHVRSQRHRETKHGLSIPPKLTLSNATDVALHPAWAFSMLRSKSFSFGNLVEVAGPNLFKQSAWLKEQFDPSIDPDVIAWVRDQWPGKLVLKSILHPEDAETAVFLGADAIVVSNHGGRQTDGAPSTISALPMIAEAVGGKIEVLFDGGIRSGLDVLKALGLGAKACLSGRAYLYGLAAGGEAGVTEALELIRQELDDALALTGAKDVDALPPDLVGGSTAGPKLAAPFRRRPKSADLVAQP